MRRIREVKEHKNALRRQALADKQRGRKNIIRRAPKTPKESSPPPPPVVVNTQPASHLSFQSFNDYVMPDQNINVCHIIESLGMGGGQTMMMELVNALSKYYGPKINNYVVCPKPTHQKYDEALYTSYGIFPKVMREKELPRFLSQKNINVALQHRLAVSKCMKPYLLSSIKYILMNHTYHQLPRLHGFGKCDYNVSVCKYLESQSVFGTEKKIVILNGVENDYVQNISPATLEGTFKTGRCHRLVSSKFHPDSLEWLNKVSEKHMPNHYHYLLGYNTEAKRMCKTLPHCNYVGTILDRNRKMSILKSLDLYFYETFAHEGASIAILEALACGVPVLCKNYGGNSELIINGVNGFIVKDRDDFLRKMIDLYSNPDKLAQLKQSTINDFNSRLHVKHTACKYIQLFSHVLK